MTPAKLQAVIEECLMRNLGILGDSCGFRANNPYGVAVAVFPAADVRDMLKAAAANLAQGLATECSDDTPPK
jgi:hypothetical protein